MLSGRHTLGRGDDRVRLEADEEEMYTRMDRRDLYRRVSAILAVAGAVFLILIVAGYRSWQMFYFALVSVAK